MKKLIVTADDYGVFPNVNQGVIDAVNKGVVNSVAVFANYDGKISSGEKKYPDSIENTQTLLEKTNGKAEIGCHLTITSGKPVTTSVAFLLDQNKRFKKFSELKNYNSVPHSRGIKEELVAQVKKLTEAGYKVKHLTCHHDSLTFFPNYYDVYLDVAKSLNLPVRSPDIRPWKKSRNYRWIVRALLMDDLKWKERKVITRFGEDIITYFYTVNDHVRTTNYMESSHYGPAPQLKRIFQLDLPHEIKKKQAELAEALSGFSNTDASSMELMLHLANDDIANLNPYEDIDYSGVDRGYFGARIAEFKSIIDFDFKPHLQGIAYHSWDDI